MEEKGLSRHAGRAVDAALEIASALGARRADERHLLAALCELRESDAHAIIKRACKDASRVRASLGAEAARLRRFPCREMSAGLEAVIARAKQSAASLGDSCVGTEQLLSALLYSENGAVNELLARAGADMAALKRSVRECEAEDYFDIPQRNAAAKRQGACDKYTRDLTLAAQRGDLDPVVGRDGETERVMAALSRRKKSNVCLTGDAGVGKTAIAEGLALRLAAGEAPEALKGKRLLALDTASLVAGTKYRGDFEERMRELLEHAAKLGDVILFIDELHSLMGAGAAEGALDAANLLKPALARGGVSVVGATTAEEYARYIEKDSAFSRRFARIDIAEPNDETALCMLRAQLPALEEHHGVTITPEALEAAVKLSRRYIPERRLPDKALDLLDEAAADMRLCGSAEILGAREVASSLSRRRGVALSADDSAERGNLLGLERRLGERVIGQREAISVVSAAVRRAQAGVRDPKRPSGCFMLCGPTGVGKTELCRALADELFCDSRAFIRLDMSEFSEPNSASRLIGAAPGYVGHELGGRLTDEVRRRPYSLVLFDELEKASAETRALLLQLMEEGELSDSSGRTADFRNCYVVCTSNVGSRAALGASRPTGFAAQSGEDGGEAAAARELEQAFSAELVNRFDAVAVFRPLEREHRIQIAENMLRSLAERLRGEGYEIAVEIGAAEAIADASRGCEAYGARPIKRAIMSLVENPVADMILSGELARGGRAVIAAERGEIFVRALLAGACAV